MAPLRATTLTALVLGLSSSGCGAPGGDGGGEQVPDQPRSVGRPGSLPERPPNELDAVVDELNDLPAFADASDHVCNTAIWAGCLLLVDHADGTATTLTADRSCALVSDGNGAVRLGLPGVIASAP